MTTDRFDAMRRLDERMSQPPWPDRELWGTSAEAQRGVAAMEALMPPASPAPPPVVAEPVEPALIEDLPLCAYALLDPVYLQG